MGLLRKIADKFDPIETRDYFSSWEYWRGANLTGAPYPVNPRLAENLSTVLACVGVVSSSIASLPVYIYKHTADGRVIDDRHPVARLIEQPNPNQTWSDFIEWVIASAMLCGNALVEIVFDSRGAPIQLNPIPWQNASVQLLPNDRLVYDITRINSMFGGTGGTHRKLSDEVFHLRDRSDNGLLGVSRLQRAAAVISSGLSIQNFASALYESGVKPSGALELPGKIGDASLEFLKSQMKQFTGSANAGRTLILDQGLKWTQIQMTPEDAEFLASRRFTTEELGRIFNVPPPMIGDLSNGSFTNVETLLRFFATGTLTPWIRKIEAEFSRSVFSEASRSTHRLEIDMSGLLRGDPAQRWQSWKIAVEAGILTPNEVRAEEGFNPINPLAASPMSAGG